MAAAPVADHHSAAGTAISAASAAAAIPRGHANQRAANVPCAVRAGVPRRVRRGHHLQCDRVVDGVVLEGLRRHNPRALVGSLHAGARADYEYIKSICFQSLIVTRIPATWMRTNTIYVVYRFWPSSIISPSTGSSIFETRHSSFSGCSSSSFTSS